MYQTSQESLASISGRGSNDFKVGKYLIEIDPTVTHNSHTNPYTYLQGKDKYYHYYKSENAKENGFFCIHIFEWDNVVQVVSQITPDGNEKDGTIQCSFDNVNTILNVLNGDNLVSSVSFSLEGNNTYRTNISTLDCHKGKFFVKLFDYFVSKYKPDKVLVEIDNSKVDGSYLLDSGFQVVHESDPVCHWYNTSSRVHYNCHEVEVPYDYDGMISKGFLPVYDCGYTTYEWTKPVSKSKMTLKFVSKI